MHIGHDIVSLAENNISPTIRHGEKILHPKELHYWQKENFSSLFYWSCWAIKESIYKLNMKVNLVDDLIFPQFNSSLHLCYSSRKYIDYSLKYQGQNIFIRLIQDESYLQAFASTQKLSMENFHLSVERIASKDQSHTVRSLILAHIPESSIEYENWKKRVNIPFLYINGKKSTNHDISMSHDGDFASSCVLERQE